MFRSLLIVIVCALVSFSDANDEESGTLNLGDALLKEELVNVPYQLWTIVRKDVEYEGSIGTVVTYIEVQDNLSCTLKTFSVVFDYKLTNNIKTGVSVKLSSLFMRPIRVRVRIFGRTTP